MIGPVNFDIPNQPLLLARTKQTFWSRFQASNLRNCRRYRLLLTDNLLLQASPGTLTSSIQQFYFCQNHSGKPKDHRCWHHAQRKVGHTLGTMHNIRQGHALCKKPLACDWMLSRSRGVGGCLVFHRSCNAHTRTNFVTFLMTDSEYPSSQKPHTQKPRLQKRSEPELSEQCKLQATPSTVFFGR